MMPSFHTTFSQQEENTMTPTIPTIKPNRKSDLIGWTLFMHNKDGKYPASLTGAEKHIVCMTAILEGWDI
jgi:hypothetical protein